MNQSYRPPAEISKKEFRNIVKTGITPEICQAVVDAVHSISDYQWLLEEFELLLEHSSEDVVGVTISSIGHLARLNANSRKKELLAILNKQLGNPRVAGRAEDAIEDVHAFLN